MGEALNQRKVQDKREKEEGFGDQSRVSGIQWEKGMEALIWHGCDVYWRLDHLHGTAGKGGPEVELNWEFLRYRGHHLLKELR